MDKTTEIRWWLWFNRLALPLQLFEVGWWAWQHNMTGSIIWGLLAFGNAASWWTRS